MAEAAALPRPAGVERPVVGVLPGCYLTRSMTFVHDQLVGVEEEFRPIVLATSLAHLDLFPFGEIHHASPARAESLATRAWRRLSGGYASLAPSQRRAFARTLRDEGAALLHAHFGPNGIEALPLARRLDLPLIVTFHGYDASSLLRLPSYRRQLRELLPRAHVVAVSRHVADRLVAEGADPARVVVHFIGIPTQSFPRVERPAAGSRAAVSVLQVGNLVQKKGHATTLRAFRALVADVPQARLVIAGDGPLRGTLEALARELGIQDRVKFLGKVSRREAAELLREADVFAHPSLTADDGDQEGLPIAIAEAMSTGLPVVATRHAGIPELITDGDDGFLADERDVAGTAAALLRAVRGGREVGARAARTVRERFDLSKQNAELRRLYHRVLDTASARLRRPA